MPIKVKIVTVLMLIAPLIVGCAEIARDTPVSADIEAHYKSTPTPAPGYARVYILPIAYQRTSNIRYVEGHVELGKTKDDAIIIGVVAPQKFLAFDVPAGSYYLSVWPTNIEATESKQTINFDSGKTIVIRPLGYYSGAGSGAIGVSVALKSNQGKPQFQFLDVNHGIAQIRSMAMISITQKAHAYVKQESPASAEIAPTSAAPASRKSQND